MEENRSGILLGEISGELHSAYHKALRVCLLNPKCKTCPLYDEHIEYKYGTKCLAHLIGAYSGKLMQITNSLEEKGK